MVRGNPYHKNFGKFLQWNVEGLILTKFWNFFFERLKTLCKVAFDLFSWPKCHVTHQNRVTWPRPTLLDCADFTHSANFFKNLLRNGDYVIENSRALPDLYCSLSSVHNHVIVSLIAPWRLLAMNFHPDSFMSHHNLSSPTPNPIYSAGAYKSY